MNIRWPSYPMLAVFSLGLAACGNEIVEPLDVDVMFHAANHHEGEYRAGASRMLTLEKVKGSDVGADEDPYSGFTMRGRLRISRVDWIAKRCGPIAYWEYQGEEAVARAVEFFDGLSLTSTSDADAFLEEALPWVPLDPSEGFPEPKPNAPETEMWSLQFAPLGGILQTALIDAGKDGTLSALNHIDQNDDGFPVVFAVEDLGASGKPLEVLNYVTEFNDRMTRRYLEEHRPKCLLD